LFLLFSFQLTEPLAPLSSQTTARTHFQAWQGTPSHPYSEMPAVVGNIHFHTLEKQRQTKRHLFFFSLW